MTTPRDPFLASDLPTPDLCRCLNCKGQADDQIEVTIADSEEGGCIEGVLPVCSKCKPELLDGYHRLQTAARELVDAGSSKEDVSRIMLDRVEAGEFH